MSFQAFLHGANAICYTKNNIKYGMTCAWAQMIDYEKISFLIGSQSITGKNLSVNDIIGVSALSSAQEDIALKLGDNHSDTTDKFKDIKYEVSKQAITINNAKQEMICKVIDILHLPYIKDDYFVICEILMHRENTNAEFLKLSDIKGY